MIRNFLFHRVNSNRDPLWDPMSPVLFEKCIRYIKKHYEIRLFEELMNSEDLSKNKNFATIMFDDGYKDNYDIALPILEKYNVKASFYIVTDCIENNVPTWTHKLEYCFQKMKLKEIRLDFEFLPPNIRYCKFSDQSSIINYARKIKPILKVISHEDRNKALKRIFELSSIESLPKLMMDWNDLKVIIDKGHCVGSHTVNHYMLGTIDDKEIIRSELNNSRDIIYSKLGFYPETISYPVGSYNSETISLSKEAGYKYGLAVKQDTYDTEIINDFEIPRIELYNETWFKTKMRINHTLERIKFFIGYRK